MDKLAMLSIIMATVAIPSAFATDKRPSAGVRKMLVASLVFNALYLAYVTLIHVAYFVPPARGY